MDHRHKLSGLAVAACLAAAAQAAPTIRFDQPAPGASFLGLIRDADLEVPEVPAPREIPSGGAFAQDHWAYWPQVKALAHEVENRARHAHREAEARSHHGDYRERQALADLHRLEEAAEHFHRQVESYRQNPGHTRHDFQSLVWAFNTADRSSRSAHFDAHVRHDIEAVRSALLRLEWYYNQGGYQPPRRDPLPPHRPWPPRRPRHPRHPGHPPHGHPRH
jgi:hypothetical protein